MKKESLLKVIMVLLCAVLSSSLFAQTEPSSPAPEGENQKKEKKEKKFRISEYISIGGYVNFLYDYSHQANNDGTLKENSAFQIRRARLDFKGNITPKLDFRVQVDFANSPKLADAYMRVKFCQYINLQAGQFKTPFTLENPYSPLDLEFTDNAQVISALAGYKDISGLSSIGLGREIGVQLYGTLAQFERDGKKHPLLTYYVGVFGGNGVNIKSDNMAKDIAGRLEFRPFLKDFVLAGSAYWGRYDNEFMDNLLRLRFGGSAEYKNDRLTVRGEYVWGKTDLTRTMAIEEIEAIERYDVTTQGFYVAAGYWFHFGWGEKSNVKQKMRPVLRYDYYQKDITAENGASCYYSAGIDWWPEKHLNFRMSYTLQDIQKNHQLGHGFNAMLSVKF